MPHPEQKNAVVNLTLESLTTCDKDCTLSNSSARLEIPRVQKVHFGCGLLVAVLVVTPVRMFRTQVV